MDYIVQLESGFDFAKARRLMGDIWHYSCYGSLAYVAVIFSLQRWMKGRERYDLRRPLFMWSLTLALFSAYGFYVSGTAHIHLLFTQGWRASVCDEIMVTGRRGLWSFVFCFSKFPELFDTVFIVLRKQKLIFLHWYHHVTVFIYCWYHYYDMSHPCQWFITMNYFVHSVMYFYYAVRASGTYRPPVWVNMVITSLQLAQMVMGVTVNLYIFLNMRADPGWYCDGIIESSFFYVYVAFAMYFSYFVLFAHFFYTSYLCKSKVKTLPPHSDASVASESSASEDESSEKSGSLTNGHFGRVGTNRYAAFSTDNGISGKMSSKDGRLSNGCVHRSAGTTSSLDNS